MNLKTILWLLAIASFAIGLLTLTVHGQGRPLTDDYVSKIPESEILQTQQHRNQLLQGDLPGILSKQADTIKLQQGSLDKATLETKGLQQQIDRQAGQLADCKVLAEKRNTAIWIRNCVIGFFVVAMGVYAFLKFYMRLPI